MVIPESNNEKPSKNSILKGKNLDVSMFSWGNIGLRSLITKWNIKFDKSIVYGEDALFWSSVYVHCDDVIKISKNIYNYRFHDGNIMSSTYLSFDTINKRINDIIYLNTAFNEILKDKNLSRTKKKVLKKKRNAQTEFLLSGLLPYSNLEYKKVLKALKKEKLYPYSFRKNAFIKAFKIKGLKHKFSHFLVWLFPLEIFYKLYYKKLSKNRKISCKTEIFYLLKFCIIQFSFQMDFAFYPLLKNKFLRQKYPFQKGVFVFCLAFARPLF